MPDLSGLVGLPFVDEGRDPGRGLDCWGLVMEVQRQLGREIPDYGVGAHETAAVAACATSAAEAEGWTRVATPSPGDVICLAIDKDLPGLTNHFGVVVDGGRFIHALGKLGVCVTPLDHPFFKTRITGYYKWNK